MHWGAKFHVQFIPTELGQQRHGSKWEEPKDSNGSTDIGKRQHWLVNRCSRQEREKSLILLDLEARLTENDRKLNLLKTRSPNYSWKMWGKVICSKLCYKDKERNKQWLKVEFWIFKEKRIHLELKYPIVLIAKYISWAGSVLLTNNLQS